jgi:hypothetical protein
MEVRLLLLTGTGRVRRFVSQNSLHFFSIIDEVLVTVEVGVSIITLQIKLTAKVGINMDYCFEFPLYLFYSHNN